MENPTTSIETETQPGYRLGLISFILSLTPLLFLGIQVVLLIRIPSSELHYSPQAFGIECLSCFGILLPLAGIGVGITSLKRKEQRKFFAISGIVLGVLGVVIMLAVGSLLGILFFSAL
jgi:hypothetical protein